MNRAWIAKHNKLLAIILLAVILRLGAAVYLGNDVTPLPGTTDQVSYHNLALRLIDGHGFSFNQNWWPVTAAEAPTAHWSYLYTFFLAAVYLLTGPYALAARILQALIVGILHPLLAYNLGKATFNHRTGLLVAAISAVYAYLVYYSATLMTEAFYITAILAGLNLTIALTRSTEPNRKRVALILGLTLGATVLLRQVFLLVIPFLFIWLWWNRYKHNEKLPLAETAIPAFVVVLLIAPFTLFNYSRFDRFVMLNTNAGYAFYWANHPIHGTNFIPILPPEMGTYRELIPGELRRQRVSDRQHGLLR